VMPYLGLLHGAAGIGLALACLAAVAGEERYFKCASGAAELLLAQAKPSSTPAFADDGETDDDALTWPRHLGDKARGLQAHCHGAGGIAQLFLGLDRLAPDPRYRQAAKRAAYTVAAQRATEARSGLCHGLSGMGDFMIDCYQAFGDEQWLALARECAGRLQRFRTPERPGVYAMHRDGAVSPDLMVGYAGVGSFLLRLVDARTAPDPILGRISKSPAASGRPRSGGYGAQSGSVMSVGAPLLVGAATGIPRAGEL
jgi:class IV lanthipeptide synthase